MPTEAETVQPGLPDGDTCVRFTPLDGIATPPANVTLFFRLETCEAGTPVLGLESKNFVLTENDSAVPVSESHLQILPRCVGYDFLNILLIDASGSMLKANTIQNVVSGAKYFVNEVVADEQPVAVYVFDGNAESEPLVDFTTDKSVLFEALESLKSRTSSDSSTNLNGALVDALALLDERFVNTSAMHFEGTVTVVTDGEDQAARVSDDAVLETIESTEHNVYAIGLGDSIRPETLERIGKDGFFQLETLATITEPFSSIASTLLAASQNYYVVGYCSPKRAGIHGIELRVDGYTGVLNAEFDASKFEGGCDADSIVSNATLEAKTCVLSPPWEDTTP